MTLSNCCGAGTRHNPDPQSTSGLLCVKCKLNCCELKPMKHTVKVGDRFLLGAWEWRVAAAPSGLLTLFRAIRETGEGADVEYHWFPRNDADSLDWIKPDVRFTREEAGRFYRLIEEYAALPLKVGQPHPSVKDFLYDHTDKE